MDDLEFRTRAFSNPLDDGADFIAATDSDPARRHLIDELTHLEQELRTVIHTIPVPDGLQQKLLAHMQSDHRNHERTKRQLFGNRLAYMMAATVVISAGLGISLVQSRPSAQDLALHDAVLEHLYHEAPGYANGLEIPAPELASVLAEAGATLTSSEDIIRLHLIFANYCGFGGEQRGAHLVTRGEHGPVSFIFIKNSPVSTNVKLDDERFKGRIIPWQNGNMAVIGEKAEALEQYEKILRDNLEWSI